MTSHLLLRFGPLFPSLSRRLHYGTPALRRPTLAEIELLIRRIVGPLVLVVISELDTRLDVPLGINPDSAVLDYRLTVRVARMIDQSGIVATTVSVDAGFLVEREQISVVAAHALVVVPAISFLVADSLSGILDNPLTRAYAPLRENTSSLDFRASNLVQSVRRLSVVT